MGVRNQCGGQHLKLTKTPVELGRFPLDEVVDGSHEHGRRHETDRRRDDQAGYGRAHARPVDGAQPVSRGDRRAQQTPDEGVRRAGGKAQIPGREVPGDRPEEGGHDQLDRGVDDQARDGVRDLAAEDDHCHDGAGEVEHRGEDDRRSRGQRAGRDRGRDGVGRVVEPVGEVEDDRRQQGRQEQPLKHS